ncbi:MAG: glycosyltransferase family 4 protein [Holophagaceae bacterium]|nr:glycosyltransferase family 4 protein [Holophagaceae bacterium]
MKHVVFAHRKLSFGGGERVMLERVAALAPLDVRITVIFRKEPDKRDIEPELRTRNPHVGDILHIPGTWGALRWLWKNPPDLLALCNHKGVQRALPWLARLGRRIPTVVTLHEHYERHLRKYRGIRKLVDTWIIDWEFEKAVQAHLGPQPCAMIHPLYPHRKSEPPSDAERREAKLKLGLPEDAVVLGYCGQIDARKDPSTTLELARCIEARLGRQVHLLFAGRVDAATRKGMEAAIDRMERWDRTRILGPVPDLAQVFRCLDAYLMTSRNEGFFPIALIEALEHGVPIVAPSVGGIGTVLADGEGGILIQKPDDRKSIARDVLESAADRVAAMLADPEALALQRRKALALGRRLTEGYDAAALFRDAVKAWIP